MEYIEYNFNPILYTIVLSDGTEIKDCLSTGSYFLSSSPVTDETFAGKLSTVTIKYVFNNANQSYNKTNIRVGDILHQDFKCLDKETQTVVSKGTFYWFAFEDIPKEKLTEDKLNAKIDYIAMMADIEWED